MLQSMDFLCFFWVGFFTVFPIPIRTIISQQQGFLSIACGGTALSVDSFNISWVPDNSYVRTGNTTTANFIDGGSSLQVPLRFFPNTGESRQCYRLPLQNSSMVLIRPHFYYKNYDGLNEPPSFWVSLGTATATTVNLTISDPWVEEFIWPVDKDAFPFCLHAIPGSGFPVISRLEIRSMPRGAYTTGREDLLNRLLRKHFRINCGYENGSLRYPFDSYDRIWDADENFSPIHLSAGFNIPLTFNLSVSALQIIQQSTGLDLGWEDDPCSPTPWKHVGCEGSLVTSLELSDINLRSISPTIGDLLDLKSLDLHNNSLTGEIKNFAGLQQLEILNLSFNELASFGSDFETLVSLQVLDLQNNSLQGNVPDSVGSLPNLHLLNLENNNLQGILPESLNKQSLEVRTSGNLCLSFSASSCNVISSHPPLQTPQVTVPYMRKDHGHKQKAILGGAIGGALSALLFIGLLLFLYRNNRRGREEGMSISGNMTDMRNWNAAKVFSYKEVKISTNNFKDIIGRGSFGSVYLGKLPDGKLVAVKVRFDRTQLGADSFINEVHLLSQVCHQSLVSLEGFCYESKQQILVYEYLPGGSLADNLYGANSKKHILSWVRRLKIAVDAAKGLDYLHNGSNPRIIHRDVKCSNILLDAEMNAKVCDFGLSKQVPQADLTHVTTVVKGTAGYLDPEYYSTQQLTEKSDVYSFGVVLLELICGREPLSRSGSPDSYNLVLWAKPYLQAGGFEVVDESLNGTFDAESMRKAGSIAVRSVERDASQRPTMAEVLAELKEAYSLQLAHLATKAGHTP